MPVSLHESDVRRRQRCAAGSHIVFIGTSGLNSMVMRGHMTHSVLNQSFASHGATSSFIYISSPLNTSLKESNMIESHFDNVGGPSACIIIKYSVAWVGAACRRRGALVFVDSIDNSRAFSQATLRNEHYMAMDAIIVQTEVHAAMVASWGHVAVVLPHPHGNLGAWSVAESVRPRLRGVGFVVADSKNMPTREDVRRMQRATCRANVTFYVVSSHTKGGLSISPYMHPNCTDGAWHGPDFSRPSGGANPSGTCDARHGGGGGGAHRLSSRAWTFGSDLESLRDPTHQRRYYESAQLLELIDVGLVWKPGHQQGGRIAQHNRPPTRMHWWWSHGIPVIGSPMAAYVDAARRAHYPEELLNLTTADHIEAALHRLAAADERQCLQRAARHGAHLSSPWYAALELLAAICAVGERCGQPLHIANPPPQTMPLSDGHAEWREQRMERKANAAIATRPPDHGFASTTKQCAVCANLSASAIEALSASDDEFDRARSAPRGEQLGVDSGIFTFALSRGKN